MARGVLMTPSSIPRFDEKHRRLLEDCFRREAGSSTPIPGDDVDLIETGILDSMGWVSFLRAVETASGTADLGSNLNERSASFAVLLSALRDSNSPPGAPERLDSSRGIAQTPALAVIAASSFTVGSRVIPSEEVDRAFGMPAGKLRSRAGIESLAYVAESENELTLAAKAAQEALGAASCGTQELDWIVTTSETHHDYPSLSAQLHSRLLVRENCGALDVGGACLGLLNALVFTISDRIGTGSNRRRRHRRRPQPNTHSRPGRRRIWRFVWRRRQRFHSSKRRRQRLQRRLSPR